MTSDLKVQSSDKLNARDQVQRILVATKYRFIGDTLLAVPLLRGINERWPDARVTLLTGGRAHEMLLHCPYVQDTIDFDPYRPSDQGLRRYFGLIQEMRRRRFDLAFVCNRSFHGALAPALGGAHRRVGWSGFQGRDFLLTVTVPYDNEASEIESYLDLLRAVAPDAPALSPKLELWLTPEEQAHAGDLLHGGDPLIGLQPGASHAEKRWPIESFAELATLAYTAHPGVRFVLLGGGDEVRESDAMQAACSADLLERMISLVGQLSLRETLAVLSRLDLFIAGDTAIRHAAAALSGSSVAVFGPTSIRKWGNASPPRHVAIAAPSAYLGDISVDSVFAAAEAALVSSSSSIVLAPQIHCVGSEVA